MQPREHNAHNGANAVYPGSAHKHDMVSGAP